MRGRRSGAEPASVGAGGNAAGLGGVEQVARQPSEHMLASIHAALDALGESGLTLARAAVDPSAELPSAGAVLVVVGELVQAAKTLRGIARIADARQRPPGAERRG